MQAVADDPAQPAGCSKRPSSKAAASEETRRTLRYVESLSDARTKLADFFNSLLAKPRKPPASVVDIGIGFRIAESNELPSIRP